MRYILFFTFLMGWALFSTAQTKKPTGEIQLKIAQYLKDKKATVGVAVLYQDSLWIEYNNARPYPLMSVFKYHIALAVLDKMNREKTPLNQPVTLDAARLLPNTHSPLRDQFPDQDVTLSLGELIRYTVSLSDNNTCDFLIEYAGGPSAVHNYIESLGIKDFHISVTEEFMHRDIQNQYLNYSFPSEVVRLMYLTDQRELFAPEYKNFLTQVLVGTTTGSNKIKGLLPPEILVGHKTGSSDRTPEGLKIADNDAGFVVLPQGEVYYIAVFVMDSLESNEENASLIAQISKIVYDGMVAQTQAPNSCH